MTLSSRRARIARYVREVARSRDDHLLHSHPDVREVAGSLDDHHLCSHRDMRQVAGSPDDHQSRSHLSSRRVRSCRQAPRCLTTTNCLIMKPQWLPLQKRRGSLRSPNSGSVKLSYDSIQTKMLTSFDIHNSEFVHLATDLAKNEHFTAAPLASS